MYLKSLELQGFKSFPEKTLLPFDSGVSVIVGPNGSGKSNITDAMRWVLGELSSKNIRGTKMEDVIFVGTDSRRPMNYAEVSVTFDNSDENQRINSPYNEITVTRRYYRSGESEYLINKKAVRLRDIYELFMNTGIGREGYSIIGQGKIAEIISKKSEERRSIFEEAAGISKYRYKKQESQKKLSETEENMLRVKDILSELESRIGPLEKEAAKARKYMELFEEKKRADISLWLYDAEKFRTDIEQLEQDFAMSAHELEMIQDTEQQLEAQNDRLFESSQDNKRSAENLYQKIREKNNELRDLDNAGSSINNAIVRDEESLKTENGRIEETKSSLEGSIQKLESLKQQLSELQQKLAEQNTSCDEKKEQIVKARAKKEETGREIERLFSQNRAREEEVMDLRVRLNVMKNALAANSERDKTILSDIEKNKAEIAVLEKKLAELDNTNAQYHGSIASCSEKIAAVNDRRKGILDKINEQRQNIHQTKAHSAALEERIKALIRLDEHFEGYSNSVKFIMQRYERGEFGNIGTIYGPLSKIIKTEERYITAVETALGSALQNIVVQDESTAKQAIYALKRANAGRATFYPITSMKGNRYGNEYQRAAEYPGFIAFADSLVEYAPEFQGVIASLLCRIAIFDNIDNASVMSKDLGYKIRTVTLDGQQINIGGSFTGGSAKRDSGILTRSAEIKRLESDKAQLDEKCSAAEEDLKKFESEYAAYDSEISGHEEQIEIIRTLLRVSESETEKCRTQRDMTAELVKNLEVDQEKLTHMKEQSLTDTAAFEQKLAELQAVIAEASAVRENLSADEYELSVEIERISAEINNEMIRIAETGKDIEVVKASIAETEQYLLDTEERLAKYHEKMDELQSRIDANKIKADENKKTAAALGAELEKMEKERAALESGNLDYERRINELRIKLREVNAKKERLLRAHTGLEAKLDKNRSELEKMTARLWDEYELTHSSAEELAYEKITAENRNHTAQVLGELKSKIRALGPVNVSSIDEYAQVSERYNDMKTQVDDLTSSKEDLEKIIFDLEEEMRKSFMASFESINKSFKEVFAELFGGGTAELLLTDPDDVLSSGIEIKAAPPGKLIKSLSLLSGGEQAFVAIALLFAILRENPSPFCIFDEIEAALDEVNVTRFAQYIKKYSDKTQFIVITHRHGTMEIADRLYGVTMPQHGISKVLSMDVGAEIAI